MIILAHRANLYGPDPARENSLAACDEALRRGFGLETDLRRDAEGRFYISHDLAGRAEENDFTAFAQLFRRYPGATVAMNVKELGYERALIELVARGDLGGAPFLFDFELLEPQSPGAAQRKIRALPGGEATPLASRCSDRHGETLPQALSIPGEVVWADEFDSLWLERWHIEAIHADGRRCFAISPELHGFSEQERLRRWQDFAAWGVDGICTDYAVAAREFFGRHH